MTILSLCGVQPKGRRLSIASNPLNEEENSEEDEYSLVSGNASIGLVGGRAIRSRSPMVNN